MSQVVKVTTKKVVVKAQVNEKYILVDENKKSPSKIKMIQKGKDLEIYIEDPKNPSEIQKEPSVIIENYYAENMNCQIVGLDEKSGEQFTYMLQSDGWSYMTPELNDTELGFFLTPLGIGAGVVGTAGVGVAISNSGGSSSDVGDDGDDNTTSAPVSPVDKTPPVSGTLSLSNYTDSGSSSTDQISTDNTFDLTISGNEAGTTVVYQVSTDGGTTWSNTTASQSSLSDGTYQFRATVTDSAGNSATTPVQTVVVDTVITAGTLSLSNYTDSGSSNSDYISNDNTFDLTISGNESGTTVVYQVSTDGGITWTNTTANQTTLADGTYSFRATVTDSAGNSATTAVQTLTIDTTPPTATITMTDTVLKIGDTSLVTITFSEAVTNFALVDLTAENGTLSDLTTSDNIIWTATFTPTANIEDTTNLISLSNTYTDVAGNTGTTASSLNYIVDTKIVVPTLALSSDTGSSSSDGITNTSTINVNEIESGATWEYKVDTGSWTTGNGTSFNASSGSHIYSVRQTDIAGNISTDSTAVTYVLDVIVPATGTLSLSNYTDSGSSNTDKISTDNTFDLTVTGNESGSTIVYQKSMDNGTTWTTTTASQSSLSDGTYSFRATVTDSAGNSATTAVQTVVVDTNSSSALNIAISNIKSDSTENLINIPSGGVSNDITPILNGTLGGANTGSSLELNSQINIYRAPDMTSAESSTPNLSGSAQLSSIPSKLIYVLSDGNYYSTVNLPTTPINGMLVQITRKSTWTVNITENGIAKYSLLNGESLYLKWNGSSWENASILAGSATVTVVSGGQSTWTFIDTGLNDNETINYFAKLEDLAGNRSAISNKYIYTLDTVVPNAPDLSLSIDSGNSSTDGITNSSIINVRGLENGATWQYSIDGGSWITGIGTSITSIEGSHNYSVKQTDIAGNISINSSVVTYVLDTTAPASGTLSLSNYTDSGSSNTDKISTDNTFDLTLSGQESGSTIAYQKSIDNGVTWTTTTSFQTSLSDGTYKFRANVTDTAGNSATTAVQTLVVDTQAPVAGILDLSNYIDSGSSSTDKISTDNTFSLAISGNETSSTVVYEKSIDNGVTWTNTTAFQAINSIGFSLDGVNWEYVEVPTNLADGTYQFRASVTDTAGNSATTAVQTVVVDTTAPNTPTVNTTTSTDNTPVITGTAILGSGETLSVTVNGATYDNVTVTAGTWSIDTATAVVSSGTLGAFSNGQYPVSAIVKDIAGNTSTDISTNEVTIAIPAGPVLTSTQSLDAVSNLDVKSALVLSFDQGITLGSGHIKIYDDMGTLGWNHVNSTTAESIRDTYDNDVDITLTNGAITAVTIGGVDYTSRFDLANSVTTVGNNLVIDLKQAIASQAGGTGTGVSPYSIAFDWDFGSNYHVNFDAGVVKSSTNPSLTNAALSDSTTLNFTTVTPANDSLGALSQKMDVTGVSTALSNSTYWVNGNQSANDGAHGKTVIDLAGKDVQVVLDTNGGSTTTGNMQTYVQLNNFAVGDNLYLSNHGDMSMATTDGISASAWGGPDRAIGDSGSAGGTGEVWIYQDAGITAIGASQDAHFESAAKWGGTAYNAIIFG